MRIWKGAENNKKITQSKWRFDEDVIFHDVDIIE